MAWIRVPERRFARAEALACRGAHTAAFTLFAAAARAGLPRAQYRLGCCYLKGLGVPSSVGDASRWLVRAAEAGDVDAQTQLAALALQGVSFLTSAGLFNQPAHEVDFKAAERWSRQAAVAGSAEAKALLGFILTAGPIDRRDQQAGEALYQESAQAGWSRGQLGLAMTILAKGEVDGRARATELLRAAADDGIATAHYLLGVLAEGDASGHANLRSAASYKAAAELGYAPAQLRYAFALMHGRGVGLDLFEAETWLRRAALAGEASAAAVLGYLYAQDGDMPPNHAEAAVWLSRAAEGGHAAAARTLAIMFLSGSGVRRDIAQAARLLRLASDAGDAAARPELVHLALAGMLDAVDNTATATCLRRAAEDGDVAAQFGFGLCMAQGVGVEQDGGEAATWIVKAAQGGSAKAKQLLAELHADLHAIMQPQTCG